VLSCAHAHSARVRACAGVCGRWASVKRGGTHRVGLANEKRPSSARSDPKNSLEGGALLPSCQLELRSKPRPLRSPPCVAGASVTGSEKEKALRSGVVRGRGRERSCGLEGVTHRTAVSSARWEGPPERGPGSDSRRGDSSKARLTSANDSPRPFGSARAGAALAGVVDSPSPPTSHPYLADSSSPPGAARAVASELCRAERFAAPRRAAESAGWGKRGIRKILLLSMSRSMRLRRFTNVALVISMRASRSASSA
jgi:hypothetical protein